MNRSVMIECINRGKEALNFEALKNRAENLSGMFSVLKPLKMKGRKGFYSCWGRFLISPGIPKMFLI